MSRKALTKQASFFLFLHGRSKEVFFPNYQFLCFVAKSALVGRSMENKKERFGESQESSKSGEVQCSPALRAGKFHANISPSHTIGDLCIIQRRSGFIRFSFHTISNSSGFLRRNFRSHGEKEAEKKKERRTTMMMAGSIIFCYHLQIPVRPPSVKDMQV